MFAHNCCSNETIIKTGKKIKIKLELGFTIPVDIYESNIDHQKYIICSNCDGEGIVESFDNYFKCDVCKGQGFIKLNDKKNIE